MVWSEIALIAVSAVLLIVALVWIITAVKRHRKKDGEVVGGVYVRKDVRYTRDDVVTDKNGNVKISLREGDIMLERNITYRVAKETRLLPGKYTVLVADENMTEVKIRLGGLVRAYAHNSDIVLAEDDEICAVSANVILR